MTDAPTYTVRFATAVSGDVRRLDKQLRGIIREKHLASIEREPLRAVPLLHELRGLRSYHFSYKGTQYRIIYEIYPQERIVLVIMIGSREGLYEALRRRLK